MCTDVLDLNEFYSSTLGQMTVRLLRARLREVWPNVRGETVLGLGYATPFLRPFREESERTLAFMPAQQGVTRWPREGRNLTALVDENDLPLPDRSVDRVLLVHAIESTEQVRPMLREIWRVMADGGRLVTVAPTRAGLWSQLGRFAGVSVIEAGKQLYAGIAERHTSPELAVVRPKLRIASSRDTQAARTRNEDGEAPA